MGILLKGWTLRNKDVDGRLPCNAEIIEDTREKLQIDDGHCNTEFLRVWAARMIGFTFLIRWVEMAALE